ncbi:MAG: DNA polymerase III subunit gamma/tau [Prevotella sp.]|nr:DNA polymerase III subunit gamma/tau [Prevotella sp.]MDY5666525.1 DNA polymerase III subunit gamma/tau [Alloprevotella sp.]
MSEYIVSARKYRPTTFDSVVGQHALTTTLKNAIAQGKLAHAYLFCGPRGVGKTTCARIFAKTINCLHPTPEGEACNECESCRAFNEQRSYNIHELDAASNNGVEDIRGLIEQVQIPPQIGRYKVFIIDEVHMLSTAAFNAFLKTLEEPPAHAIFVLATTEKHKILPTILSRCQIYDFARITVADTIKHLEYVANKEGVSFEPEALHVIAEKADGGMRDALSIFDQVTSFCEGNITYQKVIEDLNVLDYDEYFSMTDTLLKGDIPTAMNRLNNILCKGFEGNYFIGGLAAHFRNLLMSRDEQTLPLLDVSDQVRQRYHEQAMRCEPKLLYRALKLCNNCDMSYNTARNKRLLVELTLIEVAQVATGDDDAGCGRSPIRRLKPIFSHIAAPTQQQARPTAARSAAAHQPAASPHSSLHSAQATPAPNSAEAAAAAAIQRQSTYQQLVAASNNSSGYLRKPAHTISLRAMQQQIRQSNTSGQTATAASATQPSTSTSKLQKLKNEFDAERLTYYWFRYAQQLPKEKNHLMGRMKTMTLHLDTTTWTVQVEVENEMVEQYMRQEQISLMTYLRTQLRNDYITLQFNIKSSTAPHRAFSRVERFKELLNDYPDLEFMRKELNLELA